MLQAVARRGRTAGLRVVPGRVLQARQEAKLSLAQVARGKVSRTAIHLIETGKSRPTLETLTLIAERTGRPLEFFVDAEQLAALTPAVQRADPSALQVLELALAQERFQDARAQGDELLRTVTERTARARVCVLLAQACLRTASVEEALPLLAEARATFEATGDRWMLAECLDWQAAAEHLLENPSALGLARQALALAMSLEPPPGRVVVRIYGRIGAICVAQHRWQEAIAAYEHAVQAGAGLLDISRLAKMYNDLSIAYRRVGDLAAAADFAVKAVSIHELLNDQLSVGRAETNLALVLMRQGRHASAREHLDRALAIFTAADQPRGRSHILLAQAELMRDTEDFAGARARAAEAAELAGRLNEKASLSEAHQVLGTIAEAQRDTLAADGHFEKSIRVLEAMNLPERLATVHATYARALERRGDVETALRHWRLAVGATHPEAAFGAPRGGAEAAKSELA
jgi:tetratricopeptide (TPR) repeat protein